MLDAKVIEWVMSKLALNYGVRFHDLYAGMDAGMVRRNWAKELDGVSAEGIKYALRNLPEKFPPNVLEFRRLCYSRRDEAAQLALPPPKPRAMSPEDKAKLAAALGKWKTNRDPDPLGWARRLRARELACEALTLVQRQFWREALNGKPDEPAAAVSVPGVQLVARNGQFSDIDPFQVLEVVALAGPDGKWRKGVACVHTMTDEWFVDGDPEVLRGVVVAARRAANERREQP